MISCGHEFGGYRSFNLLTVNGILNNLDFLHPLVVQFILGVKGMSVAFLPESGVPVFIDAAGEHKLDCRNICEKVFLLLNNADDVITAAGAEGKIAFWGFGALTFFLFFPVFQVDWREVLIVVGERMDFVQF